ncbi:hypothetical protein ARSEF4850_006499 [Beauveria asiatica]
MSLTTAVTRRVACLTISGLVHVVTVAHRILINNQNNQRERTCMLVGDPQPICIYPDLYCQPPSQRSRGKATNEAQITTTLTYLAAAGMPLALSFFDSTY